MIKLIVSTLISLALFNTINACTNKFEGKPVNAAGDWNPISPWDALDSHGRMSFNAAKCVYTLAVGGLVPNNIYKWKVTINNSWKENYGCGTADCIFKSNSAGAIRFVFDPSTNRLSVDLTVEEDELNFVFPPQACINDKFNGKDVRAAGDWSALPLWNANEPLGKMNFDSQPVNIQLFLLVLSLISNTIGRF